MKHFIVTGANGFFGSNLVDQLLTLGHKIHGIIQTDNHWSKNINHPNLKLSKVDITDQASLNYFFDKYANSQTIVIHAAGLVSIASNIDPILKKVNVEGTKNVIEACQNSSVDRLVYISSVHAIPELPNNQVMHEIEKFDPEKVVGGYAKTKAMATRLAVEARKSGLDVVIVHPSGMIGPGDWGNGNIKQALIDYANRRLTAITHGGYNFVDVRDAAADTINASLLSSTADQNYILSGDYYPIYDLIKMVDKSHPELHHHLNMLPNWFIKFTAILAEGWYKLRRVAPTFTRYSVYTLTSNANFSHQKATKQLGFHPRPMEKTISETIDWYKKVGFVKSS